MNEVEKALAWTATASDKELSGVTQEDLVGIAALLHLNLGWGGGIDISLTDEYGWTSSGGPIVMWEEGPEDWTLTLPRSVKHYAKVRGLFLEPVNSWALGVYVA